MSETKQPEQPAKEAAVKEAPQEPVIYLGPDMPGARQYTVFNNGLPEALKERAKEKPFFNALIVPVSKLAQANTELAKEGSALNILYKKASEK